jgi:hypothetical protein
MRVQLNFPTPEFTQFRRSIASSPGIKQRLMIGALSMAARQMPLYANAMQAVGSSDFNDTHCYSLCGERVRPVLSLTINAGA